MEMSQRRTDAAPLAAAARSILACPDEVRLAVDGLEGTTGAGPVHGVDGIDGIDRADWIDGTELGLADVDGHPVLSCPSDAALARAAVERRGALLALTSGVGRPGASERDATLTVVGRLEATGDEVCDCCSELRTTLTLVPSYVLLARPSLGAEATFRVPLASFRSADHRLNRGFLQRSAEHANRCHQDELRRAVSTTTGTRLGDIVGVHLAGLRPDRVEIQWVDVSGAHSREVVFRAGATTPQELGDLLRQELHAGLC